MEFDHIFVNQSCLIFSLIHWMLLNLLFFSVINTTVGADIYVNVVVFAFPFDFPYLGSRNPALCISWFTEL